jgi:hypothetical protein
MLTIALAQRNPRKLSYSPILKFDLSMVLTDEASSAIFLVIHLTHPLIYPIDNIYLDLYPKGARVESWPGHQIT